MITFKTYFIAYGAVLIAFLALDGLWLGVLAKNDYQQAMGHLMRDTIPIWPWALFYVLYCAVIVYLVVIPNFIANSFGEGARHTIIAGALLGLAAYGAYNLTNYAIIKDWQLAISIKDWVWGVFITATTSFCGYYAAKLWN